MARKRTVTISEAAELTGLSRKAIARRVERGSLRSLVRRGRRLIPRAELVRTGLIPPEGKFEKADFEPMELLGPHAPAQSPSAGEESVVAVLLRELIGRLERQAGEIAHYRALTARAESLRLEGEIADLSARLRQLEGARPVLGLKSGHAEERSVERESPMGAERVGFTPRQSSGRPIWLPPSAAEPLNERQRGRAMTEATETDAHARPPASLSQRLLPLTVEVLFLVIVAVLAWRADLRPAMVIAVMAVSWLLVAVIEWVRWNRS